MTAHIGNEFCKKFAKSGLCGPLNPAGASDFF